MAATGRPCTVCNADRASIERELVEGVPVSRVSTGHGVTASAIQRHLRNHLPAVFADSLRAPQAANAGDLILAVADSLERAESIADRAVETGNDAMVLKAGDAITRAATVLHGRMGDKFRPELEMVREARHVLRLIHVAARVDPALAVALAVQFREQGEPDAAEEFELIASNHESRLELT